MNDYRAAWPSPALFPNAGLYPAVPAQYADTPVLTSSSGTSVPVLAVLAVAESAATNTLIHPRPGAPALIDLHPWSPPTLTLTLLVADYETYTHLRGLYADGGTVTLSDANNPWDGLAHIAAGEMSYASQATPGRPARIEARVEVIPQ